MHNIRICVFHCLAQDEKTFTLLCLTPMIMGLLLGQLKKTKYDIDTTQPQLEVKSKPIQTKLG